MMTGICILLPIAAGLLLLLSPQWKNRKTLCAYTIAALSVTTAFVAALVCLPEGDGFTLFYLTKTLPIYFRLDGVGRVFALMTAAVWLAAGVYSAGYMEHEQRKEQRYCGFYLLVFGVLLGLDCAGNLMTFYAFYELMTLLSAPLVLHNGSKEAAMAALKYLFFSFFGAYMVLFGFYFLHRFGTTITFTAGGVLSEEVIRSNGGFLLVAAFVMLLGFGVKAGMFPTHVWLPTAHPVAPAPASGVLSGIIVKAGVLGAIRTVYYLFGTDFLKGTWVQEIWLILILTTVLLGSVMAYREKLLKKRLAYSTVSQVSYVLLGLAMMTQDAFTGSVLHAMAHAFMKCGLFLAAGAIIFATGKTRVDELRGIGKRMPVTLVCFTLLSLSLIGVPPFFGFVSKWYLGTGSIASGMPVFDVLAPAVLIVSALFTAGYLLPISVNGFLPGADHEREERKEAPLIMLIPIVALTVLVAAGGMFPGKAVAFIREIAGMIMREVAG